LKRIKVCMLRTTWIYAAVVKFQYYMSTKTYLLLRTFCENIGIFVFEVRSQVDRVSTCFNNSFAEFALCCIFSYIGKIGFYVHFSFLHTWHLYSVTLRGSE